MAISSAATNLLDALLSEWHLLLQSWSASGRLTSAAQEALLLNGEPGALTELTNQWAAGDFGALPPIVLLSSADINGGLGAYALSTGTIYLNADWLAGATKEQVLAVLTEELGHHLDGQLNVVDTPGDEGEYFAALLREAGLTDAQKADLRLENNSGVIKVDNINLTIEYATTTVADSFADFSGTQGANNWYYGYYQAGNLSPSGFIQLPLYVDTLSGGIWYIGDNYFTSLDKAYGHPNGPISNRPGGTEHWAVRRWISEVDGQITISGTFDDANKGGGGDGVTGYIYVDGQIVYTQTSNNPTTPFSYSIAISIAQGSIVDFAASPRGWDGDDTYEFTAVITQTDSNEAPTNLTLSSSGIQENSSAGAVIGTLSATDPDALSTFTYELVAGDGTNDADNALVEIVGSEVKVKSGAAIDFETNPVLNLNIRVTDNGTPGLTYTKAVSAAVLNVNEVPTDLVFTSSGINENSAASTVIGTLSATDPDSGSSFTYALATGNGTNDADNALVDIVGNEVRVKSGASIDF